MKLFFYTLFITCCTSALMAQTAIVGKVDQKLPLAHQPGIAAAKALKVTYQQKGMPKLLVELKEPVVISVAAKPEKWGFFQFAKIGYCPDGIIQAKWNMTRDAIEAYGENTFGVATSTDQGRTWKLQDSVYETGLLKLPNGDYIDIVTPKPIKVEDLKLPKPVGYGADNYRRSPTTYYRLSEVPESRQGVFMKRLKSGEIHWRDEIAKLTDPDAARYSLSGLFPVLWWGDIRIAKDKSLIAGIYPGILIGKDGVADPKTGVFFYRSTDQGKSWQVQGRIPFQVDTIGDRYSKDRMGFTEPAFEILENGTYLCVMRTSDGKGNGPMYASYSKDEGKTWSVPKSITASGVLPNLLRLDNGILVMSSGRPGVQLRFSTDSNGMVWSSAFEMFPYDDNAIIKEQSGNTAMVSDGYTGLLPLDKDRFLLIYTDFAYKTGNGESRKAIKVREVRVKAY